MAIPLVLVVVADPAALDGSGGTWGEGCWTRIWVDSRGHEEEAVRAGRAALRMAAERGRAARAGIHLGGPDPSAAARAMAQAAQPGSLWISKAVERLVPRRFRFHEMPVLEVGSDAVPPYEVVEEIGPPGEFEAGAPPPGSEALIGRLVAEARRSGRIVLVGPAGSGRSRILRAVRREFAEGWVACGRCDARPPSPWGALGDILRAEAAASGFDRWDGERVVAAVKRLGGSAEDADAVALSLGLRLNADVDPPAAGGAWTRLLSRARLLCIEDLEDASAEERALLESIPPGPSILATALPGTALPRGFAAVEGLAGPAATPSALPADLRETLGAAAILGHSFWRFSLERLLVRDVAEELAAARKAGWILEREGSLMRGDGELLFRHRVLRDAALAALSPTERAFFHAAAASFYQQRAPLAGPATAARAAWHREQAR